MLTKPSSRVFFRLTRWLPEIHVARTGVLAGRDELRARGHMGSIALARWSA